MRLGQIRAERHQQVMKAAMHISKEEAKNPSKTEDVRMMILAVLGETPHSHDDPMAVGLYKAFAHLGVLQAKAKERQ